MECGHKCTHATDDARSPDDYGVRAQHSIKLYSSLRIFHGRHMFSFVQTPHRELQQYPLMSSTSIYMIPWASPWCLRACFVLFGLRVCGCCVVVHLAKTRRSMVRNKKKAISSSRLDSWIGCEISPVGSATAEVAARAGGRCRSFIAAAKRAARLVEMVD